MIRTIIWILGIPFSYFELKFLLLGERLGDGFTIYKESYDYTAPLSALSYKMIDLVFGKSRAIHQAISTLLVFVNSVVLSRLLVRNKAFPENNYLPGLFFVLLSTAIPDFFSLSPQLLSSTFILLAMNNIFRRIDNQSSDELFLYAGLYLGIACLFYIPAIIFFLVFLLSLVLFSTAILRRILLYLYGLIVPFIVTFGIFYWNGSASYWLDSIPIGLLGETQNFNVQKIQVLFIIGIPLFWLIVSLYNVFARINLGIYESKILQIMLFMGAAAVIITLITPFNPLNLIFFIPLFAFTMTYYALSLKRKILGRILPYIIVFSLGVHPVFLLFSPYLDSFHLSVPENNLSGKKLMILDDRIDAYFGNRIASPFLDPMVSRKNLTKLDRYGTAYELFQAINQNKPDIIVDNWQVMENVFYRFPILEEDYIQTSKNRYYLISN
jgi:hypothetical protein